jgi:hypothetical protein
MRGFFCCTMVQRVKFRKSNQLKNKISNFVNTVKTRNMITAKNKIQLAQKLFDTQDERILKAVQSILNAEEETIDLAPAQKKDLDKRLANHKVVS